ncbi:MAG: ABC transporter permease [Opitutaceae bacterium]|nr:ABC transporter permease [Opitutaceae bacterium]
MPHLANIVRLGVKELWSLARDPIMLVLIAYTFTVSIYVSATAMKETLNKAPIAIVDEDGSPLSARIGESFFLPRFQAPVMLSAADIDAGMDAGTYTFVLDIPPDFQRDVLAGRSPAIQLNVDATRMSQAFSGSSYIQQMVLGEVTDFVRRHRGGAPAPVELALRARFNPNLEATWFGALMEIITNVTMLSIILTGAALIREREHGTIEHLLVMPVTPAEIMLSKVWSMGLVVLLAAAFALLGVVRGVLHVPVEGSVALFLAGAALHLFATNSLGIFMATLARSMPQFGMLAVLVLLPLQLLSGNVTPRESMPQFVQMVMQAAPTTHFVALSQAILFRGAGLGVVWPQFLALGAIGAVFFGISLNRFRKTISQMA